MKIKKRRIFGIVAILAAVLSLMSLVGSSGAYFSDSKSGTISGTIGSIKVTTSGGSGADSADLNFTNLLPGELQTVTVNYQNTGANPQDVWVVFPNVPALHALNNMGTFGEFHIAANGSELFASTNLNDNRPDASGTCGPFSPSGCWPVPTKLLLASSVAPTAGGSASFSFALASKTVTPPATFNAYPAPGSVGADAAGPAGSGLPYKIVATQVGQQPS